MINKMSSAKTPANTLRDAPALCHTCCTCMHHTRAACLQPSYSPTLYDLPRELCTLVANGSVSAHSYQTSCADTQRHQ